MIQITEEETAQAGFSEDEMRLEIALMLFEKERFTLGQASRFARLHPMQFQQELALRRIPIHYGEKEFEQDLATVNQRVHARRQ